MGRAEDPGSRISSLRISVAHSTGPEETEIVELSLAPGATLVDAIKASGLLERHSWSLDCLPACGVWSKLRPLDHELQDGDRVELYRPLRVDPKEARRQRYRKSGKAPRARGGGSL